MNIPDNLIPLAAIGGGCIFLIIGTISRSIERISKNRGNAQLKALMIERGMTAAEIESVLAAPVSRKKKKLAREMEIPPQKPIVAQTGRQAW